MDNLRIDCDDIVRQRLISVFNEVDNTTVTSVDDDYLVKVTLKVHTPFLLAPRQFAYSERLQIRNITDELLKPSPVTPFIVLGLFRLGNETVICDYALIFDLIASRNKDILFRLLKIANKSIFTLLDLKDGFHQIKVHPDSTKYFSFSTPDGQFEFTRLLFDYCEAPAEFQKRISQVVQPLIREDKVLVYIDDILIPSVSIEENLSILKQVLLIFKQYNF